MSSKDRIAMVCDWLESFGGAEQLVSTTMQIYSESMDLWLTYDGRSLNEPHANYPLQIPAVIPNYKFVSAVSSIWSWKNWSEKQTKYSKVISSHHFMAHQSASSKIPHFSYVHTPARYIWRPEDDPRFANVFFTPLRKWAKKIDKAAATRVFSYACNSEFTRSQIHKSWDRDSRVIYPFVQDVFFDSSADSFSYSPKPEYLLFVGRASKSDAIIRSLAISKTAKLPLKLAISGKLDKKTLFEINRSRGQTPGVEVIKDCPTYALADLYRNAVALIHPNVEDFGMTVVESIAVGTPAIAPNRGGALEVIRPNINGETVPVDDLHAWAKAVDGVSRLKRTLLPESVSHFREKRFRQEIEDWLENGR